MHFAAQNEVLVILCYSRQRIIGVDQSPVFNRGTVIIKWVVCLEGVAVVEVKPLASAAVEILMYGQLLI